MKRYALFAGHLYYPNGGADDFRCFGDSIEELQAIYEKKSDDWSKEQGCYADPWGQIAQTDTMKIVCCDIRHKGWVLPQEREYS